MKFLIVLAAAVLITFGAQAQCENTKTNDYGSVLLKNRIMIDTNQVSGWINVVFKPKKQRGSIVVEAKKIGQITCLEQDKDNVIIGAGGEYYTFQNGTKFSCEAQVTLTFNADYVSVFSKSAPTSISLRGLNDKKIFIPLSDEQQRKLQQYFACINGKLE